MSPAGLLRIAGCPPNARSVVTPSITPSSTPAASPTAVRTEIELEILRGVYGLAMHLGHEMAKIVGHRRDQFEIYALTALARTGSLKQARLAEIIGRSSVFTSRLVDQLERDGLVERAEHPFDRRVNKVRLTPAGVEAYERMKLRSSELSDTLFHDVPDDRLVQLAQAMRGLSANIGFRVDLDFPG